MGKSNFIYGDNKNTNEKGDESVENRNNRLLNAKLNKYIVPGIMMSLALQLGNIVDTIFVSNLIGVEPMSAVTMRDRKSVV